MRSPAEVLQDLLRHHPESLRFDRGNVEFATRAAELLDKLESHARRTRCRKGDAGAEWDDDAGESSVLDGEDEQEWVSLTSGHSVVKWSRKRFRDEVRELSEEQRRILEAVEAHACGGQELDALRLFVSGEGGTGKTRLLHCAVQSIARHGAPEHVAVAAFTGTAASLVDGQTLHSLLGLPCVPKGQRVPRLPPLNGPRLKDLENFWRSKRYLIIDEVVGGNCGAGRELAGARASCERRESRAGSGAKRLSREGAQGGFG